METKKSSNRYRCVGKFKSYYVVWKPKRASAVPAATASLNRTMQYGNY